MKITERRLNNDGTLRTQSHTRNEDPLPHGHSNSGYDSVHFSRARAAGALHVGHQLINRRHSSNYHWSSIETVSENGTLVIKDESAVSEQVATYGDQSGHGSVEDNEEDNVDMDVNEEYDEPWSGGEDSSEQPRPKVSNSSIKLKLEGDVDVWDFD